MTDESKRLPVPSAAMKLQRMAARAGALTEFNPQQTRMKVGALKSAIGLARKIQEWEALDIAIDELIAEQRSFVAWWDANVTPGGQGGDRKSKDHGHQKMTVISVTAATAQTGVTKQQVSKWRQHLAAEADYRAMLHDAAGVIAWALHEWHTPAEYLQLARDVLGGIDLDPASTVMAQHSVQAKAYFTSKQDGRVQDWHGRVWLNPPYAQPLIGEFVDKLIAERAAGRVSAAIMLTHNYTDTTWFQKAAVVADAICFSRGRIHFIDRHGEPNDSPVQGQAFFYFGEDRARFIDLFDPAVGFAMVRP
jgi:hypothetical protein